MTANREIEKTVRLEWGRLLSSLIGQLRDFELAEDSLQDALESALIHWKRNGLPNSPYAWLLQTARRKAIDRIRRNINFRSKQADYALLLEQEEAEPTELEKSAIPDERLQLIFTCCHPALEEKSRVALTLRTLGGLTTREIARAFLDKEEAMAQRLVRAKRKIKLAGIPYAIPQEEDWQERLNSVLNVLYLIFNEGYSASSGDKHIRSDLCEEAIRLTRIVLKLTPKEGEVKGLVALMLLNHSRKKARTEQVEGFIPLERQDRSLWDRAMISEGEILVEAALSGGKAGPFAIQAAISALHVQAVTYEKTGWLEITLLYDALYKLIPNPVIKLNQLVAYSFAKSPAQALALMAPLENDLMDYQPYHASRADFLRRLGEKDKAREAYEKAISLSNSSYEVSFLNSRIKELMVDDRNVTDSRSA